MLRLGFQSYLVYTSPSAEITTTYCSTAFCSKCKVSADNLCLKFFHIRTKKMYLESLTQAVLFFSLYHSVDFLL